VGSQLQRPETAIRYTFSPLGIKEKSAQKQLNCFVISTLASHLAVDLTAGIC